MFNEIIEKLMKGSMKIISIPDIQQFIVKRNNSSI